MSHGRRLVEKRSAPRAEFISEAALRYGVGLHIDPDAAIDAKRQHRIALQRYVVRDGMPTRSKGEVASTECL
jgi:hypothetical protein